MNNKGVHTNVWNSTWVTRHPSKPFLFSVEELNNGSVVSLLVGPDGYLPLFLLFLLIPLFVLSFRSFFSICFYSNVFICAGSWVKSTKYHLKDHTHATHQLTKQVGINFLFHSSFVYLFILLFFIYCCLFKKKESI